MIIIDLYVITQFRGREHGLKDQIFLYKIDAFIFI